MKKTVIATGLSGLVGSKIAQVLGDEFDLINLDISSLTNPVDITDKNQVEKEVAKHPGSPILHLAAFTNVTAAWEQTNDKTGLCYKINVTGTENVARSASQNGNYLIHISTAYVFDGQKTAPYLETDAPRPIEWYGQTKAWAEEVVTQSSAQSVILRIDQPFRSDLYQRPDIVAKVLEKLAKNQLPPQFTDHTFGPTYVDDFAKVVGWALQTKPEGIYHATSGEAWTDWQFARAVARLAGFDPEQIQAGTLEEYLKQQNRPYQKNTVLNCNKLLSQLPFTLESVEDALALRCSRQD